MIKEVDEITTIVAFIGPSASGKSTLRDSLDFKRIVTYTTRPKRAGETEGIDYNYTTEREIAEMNKRNELLELSEYGNHLYATSLQSIKNAIEKDIKSSIILDKNGIEKLKATFKESVLVLGIYAPFKECEKRLHSRLENAETIKIRLDSYEKEIEYIREHSDVIVNNSESNWNKAKEVMEIIKYGILKRSFL